MATTRKDVPADIDALRAALIVERARTAQVEAERVPLVKAALRTAGDCGMSVRSWS
jgi:hypothetical protein